MTDIIDLEILRRKIDIEFIERFQGLKCARLVLLHFVFTL